MTIPLTHPVFTAQLNTKFRVLREGLEAVELELVEVGEFLESPNQERFSIIFRGPRDYFLTQQLYPFEHEVMGRFDLFIVPISQKEDGYRYEAIFNRLRK